MIDDYALMILERPDDQVTLIAFCVAALGGLVAWGTDRSTKFMARGRYWALSGLIGLAVMVVQLVVVQLLIAALASGRFWMLVAAEGVAFFLAGFFLVRTAAARSRDATGRSSFALLGLVPILSLFLFFKRSKHPPDGAEAGDHGLLGGGFGVFVGIAAIMLATSLGKFIDKEVDRMSAELSQPDAP